MLDTAPYYLVLLVAAIPALTDRIKKPSTGWACFFVLLLLFIGLRFEVGGDWWGYNVLADIAMGQQFNELFEHAEIGFNFLLWASVQLGLKIYGVNMVTTALFLYGLFKYCRKQLNPWLAIFTALPFLVIVIAMSANRQAVAIGVTLLVMAGWSTSSLSKKLILIFFASMFHTSAAIFVLFVILDSRISLLKKSILSIGLFTVVIKFLSSSESVVRYQSSYVTDANINVSYGALQQIMLNALPAIVILLMSLRRSQLKSKIPHWNIIFVMSILSVVLIPMSFSFSLAAARISFYLFPVSIVFFATLPEIFPASSKEIVKFFVVLYGFIVMGLWLNFANTAWLHIPYNNALFLMF